MRFEQVIGLLALTALVLGGLPADIAAQPEWPNCENFLDQDDAQATYDADRGDPFDLASSEPVNDVPCEDEQNFGTAPLVSCDALTEHPDAQQALQGLYDHTRDEGDSYGLERLAEKLALCQAVAVKQYSADRRERLLGAIDAGLPQAEAARLFGVRVYMSTITRWRQRQQSDRLRRRFPSTWAAATDRTGG